MENTTNTSPKKQIARQGKMSPPEIESWMIYSWEAKQQTPARLEDAAKYLAVKHFQFCNKFTNGEVHGEMVPDDSLLRELGLDKRPEEV